MALFIPVTSAPKQPTRNVNLVVDGCGRNMPGVELGTDTSVLSSYLPSTSATSSAGEIEPTGTSSSASGNIAPGIVTPQSGVDAAASGDIPIPTTLDHQIYSFLGQIRPDKKFQEANVSASLDLAFKTDGMNQKEFDKLLGVQTTKKFWDDITLGKGNIKDRNELLIILKDTLSSMDLTGERSFKQLAETKYLVIISARTMTSKVKEMGWSNADLGNTAVSNAFHYAAVASVVGSDEPAQSFDKLNSEGWKLFTMGLTNSFIEDAGKKFGYPTINKLMLADKWAVDRFAPILQSYYQNKDYMKDYKSLKRDIDQLLGYQKNLERFRKWAKEKSLAERIDAINFDAKTVTPEGKYVTDLIFENYEKQGTEWVIDTLNKYAADIPVPVSGGS
ncbi:hypothetical protein A3J90_05150 [candidate division WOR-1 bacterium RIFOXYC2_FULL_37_10]|uniref:Uncharacterized protein n=1 Tax=candidate division WOR-1 bacterium RIFOXYB2_FULL_37_13 TaxID=1802579 RepID=A0A1F4SN33_UNCSA|nr:MAG: hypothetical protein A2246_02690 [candidate division WOR-1 bacterium RIFOXYA2_FULL_37_7]OGC21767.1 MAG: hypothetical protein A2310_00475 [candidate division WOR-1 bacterium RIFOXYB2_FULL_37_13]OGC36723.1 MAG: hypothetical protein A3J90_05150 [candidate division WOR-1 bacterium RIFOXYC2_FULL_37_10]